MVWTTTASLQRHFSAWLLWRCSDGCKFHGENGAVQICVDAGRDEVARSSSSPATWVLRFQVGGVAGAGDRMVCYSGGAAMVRDENRTATNA